ncbi:MAG TPA: YceI family protein [Polyangiaceae bacterium]
MPRFALSPDSRVLVDLRATGLLRALGHNPTLVAHPEPATVEAEEGDAGTTATIALRFPVARIDPPEDVGRDDRDKMRENMLAPEVLDAARFPAVDVKARWRGGPDSGRLEVDATLRGKSHALAMAVVLEREGNDVLARGTWEGRLTDLGIKPFRALMGALKLEDWVRLRLEARLSPSTG